MLGRDDLVGVQAAVDPDDRLALLRQGAGLGFVDALGQGQLAGDPAIVVQLGQVLRAGDGHHILGAALLSLADGDHLQAVGLARQGFPVADQLGVVGQEVVLAGLVAPGLLGRGDGGVDGGRRLGREGWGGGGSGAGGLGEDGPRGL